MADSFQPLSEGLAPFDERDLDAVLAGQMSDLPVALRSVADVLAALRAGPAPAELRGEADAMAEFQALGLGQAEHLAHPAVQAATLLLEAPPAAPRAGHRGPQSARRRGHPGRRRAPRRASRRPGVLLGASAAAAIVLALVIVGNFAGLFSANTARPLASPSAATHATRHSAARPTGTPSAAIEGTAHPSPSTAPAQSAGSQACRSYYMEYQHPGPSAWVAELALWHELTRLVGTRDPGQVIRYCAQYVQDLVPDRTPVVGQDPLPVRAGKGYQGNGRSGQQGGLGDSQLGSGNGQGDSHVTGPKSDR
jgi:hypothetical protein